jgi:hypothetical protein
MFHCAAFSNAFDGGVDFGCGSVGVSKRGVKCGFVFFFRPVEKGRYEERFFRLSNVRPLGAPFFSVPDIEQVVFDLKGGREVAGVCPHYFSRFRIGSGENRPPFATRFEQFPGFKVRQFQVLIF